MKPDTFLIQINNACKKHAIMDLQHIPTYSRDCHIKAIIIKTKCAKILGDVMLATITQPFPSNDFLSFFFFLVRETRRKGNNTYIRMPLSSQKY